MASAALKARMRRPALWNKLHTADELPHRFPAGEYIGWSGFAGGLFPLCWPVMGRMTVFGF